jgi:hypothetical protein
VQEAEIGLVLVAIISGVAYFVYCSGLFVEERLSVTVEEVGNLGLADVIFGDFRCEILDYLPCRWQVTLSEPLYVIAEVTLLLW